MVAGGVVQPAGGPQELVLVRRGVVVGAELRERARVGARVLVGEREQPLGVVQERRRVRRVGGLHEDADKKFELTGRHAVPG